MKFSIATTCVSVGLFFTTMAHGQYDTMDTHENVQSWSTDYQNEVDNEIHTRSRRAVDLRTLRRLMNNIAYSEYYRLRGLELLGNLGMGHGRPGGLPANPPGTTAHNSLTSMSVPNNALMAALASQQIASVAAPPSSLLAAQGAASGGGSGKDAMFVFPQRSNEFQQFFGTLARNRNKRLG